MVKKGEGWGMIFYFVQRGETLYAIAKRYQTTVHAIVAANRLEDPNAVAPGQALIIPRPGEVPAPPPGGIVHLVRPGETVFHLASKFGTVPHDILRANQIAHPEFIQAGQQLVIPEGAEAGEDWPMWGRTAGRTGAGPVTLAGTPAEGWVYTPRKNLGILPSAPVIRYDRVFVGLGDGQFYALCRRTGRAKWRYPAGTAQQLGEMRGHALAAPAVFDGLVYTATPHGAVLGLDAYAGHLIWKVVTGSTHPTAPAAARGVVYIGGQDGVVHALEAKTGAVVWRREIGSPLMQPVAVGDDATFAVTADGTLWSLEAETGRLQWKVPAVHGQPVFAEVLVLLGHRAYDPRNGQLVWESDRAAGQPVSRLDEVIYATGAADLFTGTWKRTFRQDGPVLPAVHVVTSSHIVGLDTDRGLLAWDLESGEQAWTLPLPALAHQPPGAAPGQLVVTLADGSVRAYCFAESA
jgi:outer membrane protein assembly factor BamB